jgi:hypothetical protein
VGETFFRLLTFLIHDALSLKRAGLAVKHVIFPSLLLTVFVSAANKENNISLRREKYEKL